MTVLGVTYSLAAVHAVLLPRDSASDGPVASLRLRMDDMLDELPRLHLLGDAKGHQPVLVVLEDPRRAFIRVSPSLYTTLGGLFANLPPDIPIWPLPPEQWKAATAGDGDVVEWATATWPDSPAGLEEPMAVAFALAYTGRAALDMARAEIVVMQRDAAVVAEVLGREQEIEAT